MLGLFDIYLPNILSRLIQLVSLKMGDNTEDDTSSQSNVSHQCIRCKNDVTESEHGVQCELCNLWVHISCEKIPKSVYNYIVKSESNFHWFCEGCDTHAMKSLKSIQSLSDDNDKMKDTMSSILARLIDLEQKMATAKDIQIPVNNTKPEANDFDSEIKEALEIESRRSNLIFKNVPEDDVTSDADKVKDIISVLDVNNIDIESCVRLGQSGENKRLLRVKVKSIHDRFNLLKNSRNLKDSTHKDIFIQRDLTKKQQQKDYILRNELKRRIKNGEQDLFLSKGKILSKKK